MDKFTKKIMNADYELNPEFADLFLNQFNSRCYKLSIEYAESIDLKKGTHEFVNAARDFRYGYLQAIKDFKNDNKL